MSPAVSRLHYPASDDVLDAWWRVLATTYIMWVLLLVACPAFTCDMCKFPPLADLHGLPEGGFIVGQGNYVMFSHVTTVATGIGSFAWVEVPA